MKRVCIIFSLILPLVLPAQKKQLTFEQVYQMGGERLQKPLPRILGWADDANYFQLQKQTLLRVNARSGKSVPLISAEESKRWRKEGFTLSDLSSADGNILKHIAIKKGDIYILLRNKCKVIRVTQTEGIEQNPIFSPDGKSIAFTYRGNLFAYDIQKRHTIQLTRDGSQNILNGYASWVYYEEILGRRGRYRAFWWSPDSKKIVFMRFDQTKVPVFPIFRSTGIYGELEQQRYPKPGYPNPQVTLGIAHLTTGQTEWIHCKDERDHYLTFPRWNHGGDTIFFQWMNRGQDHLKIYAYDLSTKKLRLAYEERQKTWIDFMDTRDLYILKNDSLVLRSSQDGWYHIYLVDKKGLTRQITSGDWSVSSILKINEKKKTIFFSGSKGQSTESHLYSVHTNGKRFRSLSKSEGSHFTTLSTNGSFYIDRYSSISQPTRMALYNRNGKLIRQLGDSYSPVIKQYQLAKVELFRITTSDGYSLPARWYLPANFDKSHQYPVIFTIYGGPGAATVRNSYSRGLGNHFLAQQGIIIISVDHRGSGHFGKRGMDAMYRNLGKWEMHDYIEAVKYLRKLPFIDKDRIGITGGSYGGYVTAMALTFGSEYFKYGIAASSVIDWKLYDTIYTERYMDTPEENPEGYQKASVLSYIEKYQGGLKITHGSMDDNVHMQNTIQFMDKILNTGKSIELMIYPGQRHGIRGKKRVSVYRSNLHFWQRHFFNADKGNETN